jgi:hypothetical protein
MSKVKKKKNEYVKIEYRKKVRRRRGFFSQQSIMMPRPHPAPMKTGTNELAQHIGPPCHGVTMKLTVFFLLFSCLLVHVVPGTGPRVPTLPLQGQTLKDFIPVDWKLIKSTKGDLNKDGEEDIAGVIEDTKVKPGPDEAPGRILFIIFKQGDGYELSIQTGKAILKSNEGGIMGDPFSGLNYDRGSILIGFYGGSRERWGFELRFRIQDKGWFLIGFTKTLIDTLTGRETTEDYNLLTGKAIITKKEGEKTVEERVKKRGRRKLVNLKDFVASNIETLEY